MMHLSHPHTVIVISATFKAVVRLVKTILSYAIYHPGDTRSRTLGFQNVSSARAPCPFIISLYLPTPIKQFRNFTHLILCG